MDGKFTERARKVMQLANEEALCFGKETYIDTQHVLLGLVKEGSGVAAHVLKSHGVDVPALRVEIERLDQCGPYKDARGKLPMNPLVQKIIENSLEEVVHLGHNYVGTEHILLGLLREQEGVAAQVLRNLALEPGSIRKDVFELLGHEIDC